MRPIRTFFLSGPRFGADESLVAEARALCAAAGFEAVVPGSQDLTERDASEAMAREIYAQRASLLRRADALIVDLTPVRGPGADPAAAFEAGFAAGLGRPVFAYLNVRDEAEAELAARIEAHSGATPGDDGVWRDDDGLAIEDFGLPECVMLWAEARRLFVIVTPEPGRDLTGLMMCLEAARMYAD